MIAPGPAALQLHPFAHVVIDEAWRAPVPGAAIRDARRELAGMPAGIPYRRITRYTAAQLASELGWKVSSVQHWELTQGPPPLRWELYGLLVFRGRDPRNVTGLLPFLS